MGRSLQEECGVFAVYGHEKAPELCYYGLYALQHRGQESAGMAVSQGGRIRSHKGMGLVGDVFSSGAVKSMAGDAALGHVRSFAAGEDRVEDAQPIAVTMWRGEFALGHNGNLVNAEELRASLERQGSIFQTASDSELILHLLARSPSKVAIDAFSAALSQIKGAYAVIVLTPEGILAAKDPHGFRPLCIGSLDGGYVVSSETCGLDAVGARFIREVEPGEILQVTKDETGKPRLRSIKGPRAETSSLCVFEFIYFARPDSDINGLNVHSVRKALGRLLAKKSPVEADLVTGVPDSSLSAATGYAEQSGIPYEMGLVKNRYIGRTFLTPEQAIRDISVKIKLNPLRSLVAGKRVVLVDDSIVRGTTSRYIVSLLKTAGAAEVHVRISSPPYRYRCHYGIDTSSKGRLAASFLDTEGVAKAIGADSLAYLGIEDLHEVLGGKIPTFCDACFSGQYPVEDVDYHDGEGIRQ